jgi:thiosulfate reductase cytochrome b subunit
MNASIKRAILRWVHLVTTIPILGYIYGPTSEVAQYADGVRTIFVPVLILTGYAMYAGLLFAILGTAAWLAAVHFSGFGTALLSQVALLIGRKMWLMIQARKPK